MTGLSIAELHYLAETADWRTDRYYRYDEMTQLLRGWVDAHPAIATLGSIGQTDEGRDIWVVTITNRETGPDTEKPAYYVDANIHAGEVTGSAVALGNIHYLLTHYGTDERVTRLLDETAVYVVPRIMIDASEVYLTTSQRMRSSLREYPHTEVQDGIQVEDIDGDGVIAYMRVKDPDGVWKVSAEDDRVMVRRGPDETGGEYYFVHPEGLIENYDGGVVRVAPSKWGLDLNRNMPHDWKPEWVQKGAGPYPLSEPETRAVADFLLGHPNIHGAQHYHTQSGVILRASSLRPDDDLPELDLRAYKAIGALGEDETGYRCVSIYHDFAYDKKKPIYGTFIDWMYDDLGVFSFSTELWSLPRQAGIDVPDFIKWPMERTEEDDLKMLRVLDQQTDGRGFTPWRPFNHPQLGEVEIGGWDFKFGIQNPPGPLLEQEIARNVPFTIRAMGTAPRLHLLDSGAEKVGEGVYRVWVVVGNSGFLPTYGAEVSRGNGQIKPVRAVIELPDGANLVSASGKAEQDLGHLGGRLAQYTALAQRSEYPNVSRKQVEWVVAAAEGTAIPIRIWTPRAGTVRTTVTLG